MTFAFWLTVAFAAFALLFLAGTAIYSLCEAADERKKQSTLNHLDRLRREAEMEEKRKQYRKVVRKEPPGLIRIKELGWRNQPCGHSVYEWSDVHQQCLQCVAEGRQASRDMGRQ